MRTPEEQLLWEIFTGEPEQTDPIDLTPTAVSSTIQVDATNRHER